MKSRVAFWVGSNYINPGDMRQNALGQGRIQPVSLGMGLAIADAGPNARLRRGAPPSSDFMTSSHSFNRVTIVEKRRYTVQH